MFGYASGVRRKCFKICDVSFAYLEWNFPEIRRRKWKKKSLWRNIALNFPKTNIITNSRIICRRQSENWIPSVYHNRVTSFSHLSFKLPPFFFRKALSLKGSILLPGQSRRNNVAVMLLVLPLPGELEDGARKVISNCKDN